MDGLDPFLSNLNPIVRWLDYQAPVVGDFLSNPSSSTSDFLPSQPGQGAPLHLSRQMTIFTNESLSVYPQRLNTNRGNGYLQPFAIGSFFPTTQGEIFPEPRLRQHQQLPQRRLGHRRPRQRPGDPLAGLEPAAVGERPVPALIAHSAAGAELHQPGSCPELERHSAAARRPLRVRCVHHRAELPGRLRGRQESPEAAGRDP